jgi:hypothetical protein
MHTIIIMGRNSGYVPPSYKSIFGGLLIGILLLFAFLELPIIVKVLGAPFMILPAQLGLIPSVERSQVLTIDLDTRQTMLEFTQPGTYVVYTADPHLLELSDYMAAKKTPTWLRVFPSWSREELDIKMIERGLIPFDSVWAPGRPVLTFEILTPGEYTLLHPARKVPISILPDAVSGNEGRLTLAALVQIGILLTPFWLRWAKNRRARQARLREIRALGRGAALKG